ncbi:25617_t:CDS:2 [Dentiscutata erythropus]|uniref:25617_t:CDS:1 n=1 Tax=Dentiscutata erythropus TaxID=1348616 RepID=A0A9N9DZV2_9GLOM|nr:25617_t:CDS:2 [Dentiscutata erythropus]
MAEEYKRESYTNLLDEEERKHKVNRSLVQKISRNSVKLVEHSSQSLKKDYKKENRPPKSQKKIKLTNNSNPKNNSIHNIMSKILNKLNKLESQKGPSAGDTLAYCS